MKRIIFLSLLLFSSISFASLFDGKYSPNQVFDVQRNGCYSVGGACSVSNMIAPFIAPYTNWTHPTFATGDYMQFFDTGAGSNNIGLKQFASDGTFKQTISANGYVMAIGSGIVYIGVPSVGGGTGFFISNDTGYALYSSANVTVQYVNQTMTELNSYVASTTPLAAGQTAAPAPTVVSTTTTYTSRTATSGNTTYTYRTPVTITTWSDNTSTSSNGTEALYNTAVSSTVVTNKINGSTLTTYSTPIITNTPANGGSSYIVANGQQTSSSQQVQTGLTYKVADFDAYTYSCGWLGCVKNLLGPYRVPDLTPNHYTTNHTGTTTNGVYVPTNGSFPNMGDGTLITYNGTITAPITTSHPAGSVYRIYFYSNNDDGYVMKINGTSVINDPSTYQFQNISGGYNSSGYLDLVAGQTYNFEAWHWNDIGGWGMNLQWNVGNGRTTIPNSAFTTGTISNISIDLTGVSYSNDTIVPVAGLCCGASSASFNADANNVTKVNTFVNRTSNDGQVTIEQIGNNNEITVNQTGTSNNYVKYYGNGDFNTTTINQSSTTPTATNYVDVSINGSDNNLAITQQSTGGTKGAFVDISNSNNSVTLLQKDNGNHYASINVSGGNKTVDVTQQGSGSHMADITLSGNQTGLTLTQSGSTQQYYSINFNCATAGGCAPISVQQGQ